MDKPTTAAVHGHHSQCYSPWRVLAFFSTLPHSFLFFVTHLHTRTNDLLRFSSILSSHIILSFFFGFLLPGLLWNIRLVILSSVIFYRWTAQHTIATLMSLNISTFFTELLELITLLYSLHFIHHKCSIYFS